MVLKIFWNDTENRIRAGWRIFIQIILIAVPLAILAISGVYSSGDSMTTRVTITVLPITLLSIFILGRYIDKRKFSDYGIQLRQKKWWADYGFGLLAGLLSASSFVYLLVLFGWAEIEPSVGFGANGVSFTRALLISLFTYAGVGVFEEILRTYQVRNLTEGFAGTKLSMTGAMLIAVFLAGLWSVVMHVASNDLIFLVYIWVTSVIYGFFFCWTERAALAMAMHFSWDFTISTIFLLDGSSTQETAFFIVSTNSVLDMGANVLPIVGLLAKFLGLIAVAMWIRWREGKIQFHREIASPSLITKDVYSP